MMNKRCFQPVGLMVGIFLLLTTCSAQRTLIFRSTPELNNGGNPVVVRIYQLKSAGNFQRTSLDEFWGTGAKSFASDVVGEPMEVLLRPGETRRIAKLKIQDGVNFIGVAADFYMPEGEQWRAVMETQSKRGGDIVLALGKNRLLVSNIE